MHSARHLFYDLAAISAQFGELCALVDLVELADPPHGEVGLGLVGLGLLELPVDVRRPAARESDGVVAACSRLVGLERVAHDSTCVAVHPVTDRVGALVVTDDLDVAYVFAEDRSGSTPITLLEGTTGVLLVDGYSGYNVVDEVSTRPRAACHAHVRRYFHEALPTAPVAQEMLDLVAQLYVAEDAADAQGLVGPAKLDFRKQRAGPIRERM